MYGNGVIHCNLWYVLLRQIGGQGLEMKHAMMEAALVEKAQLETALKANTVLSSHFKDKVQSPMDDKTMRAHLSGKIKLPKEVRSISSTQRVRDMKYAEVVYTSVQVSDWIIPLKVQYLFLFM